MALIKNPFSREKADKQLTPDLSPSKEIKPEEAIKQEIAKKQEQAREAVDQQGKEKLSPVEKDAPTPGKTQAPQAAGGALPPQKSINQQKIEKVMEENLEEIYFNMDEAHRTLFKVEGDRAAREIDKIVNAGKSVAVKVLEVLKRWLRLIPGVNKFFIEQEAKIKTDKILKETHV